MAITITTTRTMTVSGTKLTVVNLIDFLADSDPESVVTIKQVKGEPGTPYESISITVVEETGGESL